MLTENLVQICKICDQGRKCDLSKRICSLQTPYQHARPFPNSTHALEGLPPSSKPIYMYFVAR